jgi:predicted MPP superfamily phosphohydrolase
MLFIILGSKLVLDIFVLSAAVVFVLKFLTIEIFHLFAKTELFVLTINYSGYIIKTGFISSLIIFFTLVYGMLFNTYKYQTKRLKLILPNLPDSFNGFKIVQISDLHLGSFLNSKPLTRAVNIINEQKADIFFFTGDLVNSKYEEVLPYVDVLRRIEAKYGAFSIFGNHDYGDHVKWQDAEAKKDNVQKLKEIHKKLGWDLLWDEHRIIEQKGEHLTVIGVQNCRSHGFISYGCLGKATENIKYSNVNILLSHDPSFWKKEVVKNYPDIDITLSGHTHGMQFGIDIAGIKWSPVRYLYREWAGLYKINNQYLYTNTGLGFIGYHGRVGVLPEITVIELRKT